MSAANRFVGEQRWNNRRPRKTRPARCLRRLPGRILALANTRSSVIRRSGRWPVRYLRWFVYSQRKLALTRNQYRWTVSDLLRSIPCPGNSYDHPLRGCPPFGLPSSYQPWNGRRRSFSGNWPIVFPNYNFPIATYRFLV